MIGLRHSDQWVGLLVVAAFALFFGVVLDVGLLRDWFRPTAILRIVLPPTGVGGLATGADVEVLGIRAGAVRRLVIQAEGQMYAEAEIDQQAQAFIRRDSEAVIRRRFGVAGAAYIDISRGSGAPMDWKYAVIDATTERAPTDSISAMIDELREKVYPILDDTRRTVASLAAITERVEKGEGTVGRLVTTDTLSRKVEAAVDSVQDDITHLDRVIDELDAAAKDAHAVADSAAAADTGMPAILRRVNTLIATLQSASHDLAQATPHLPQIARNAEAVSADLPALLTQIQVTAMELEKLLTQLRGSWVLGGNTAAAPEPRRVPASNAQP
ncbi:MAG TPA: MlaD family protein [Stellaceae bacterium]|nr:MlaD family protein [Stellaceae bacterium]